MTTRKRRKYNKKLMNVGKELMVDEWYANTCSSLVPTDKLRKNNANIIYKFPCLGCQSGCLQMSKQNVLLFQATIDVDVVIQPWEIWSIGANQTTPLSGRIMT
jgi:hypothetical protein